MSSDEDFKPDVSERPTKKRKPMGRGAVACMQCRASKLACDLKSPACSSCVKKGKDCSIGNLLWYDNPEDAPAAKLKASVDRLEALVHKIRAGSSSAPNSDTGSSRPTPLSPRSSIHGSSGASSSACSSPRLTRRVGHAPQDAELLSRLVLGVHDVGGSASPSIDLPAIVSELQYSDLPTTEPLPHLAEPSSKYSRPSPETFAAVFQIMPTKRQASEAIKHYFARADLLHVLHHARFVSQCNAFWESGRATDLHWLATYLCITGLGLLQMTDREAAEHQMPSGDGKALLARSWLDGALQALFSGEFLKSPSLESIRAVVLLNEFWSTWMGGKHLQAAISFNTAVVATCFELELHIDPDEIDREFRPLEAEERRRVFWALFTQDTLARSFLGKSYAPLDVSLITVCLPSPTSDEAFTTEGDFNFTFTPVAADSSTSPLQPLVALHSLSAILAKISTLVGKSKQASESEITKLHEELIALEFTFAPVLDDSVLFTESLGSSSHSGEEGSRRSDKISVKALVAYAFVRLHRTSMGTGTPDQSEESNWHRTVCLQRANKLLDLAEHVPKCNSGVQLSIALAVCVSGITLAVDLLDQPYAPTADETRARLGQLISSFDFPSWPVDTLRVLHRSSIILRHVTTRAADTFVTPAFFSGHSRSGSASSGSAMDQSMIDTPPTFLLPAGFDPHAGGGHRRASDQSSMGQFLSPMLSDQGLASFTDSYSESYYSGDFSPPPPPPFNYQAKLPFDLTYEGPSPLLKPWLATQLGACGAWGFATTSPMVRDLFV